MNKVLFYDSPEQYCKIDNWPQENDRAFVFRIVSELPIYGDTLLKIFEIGTRRDLPLNPNDTCEISYSLIVRAATIYMDPEITYPVFYNFGDCRTFVDKLFDSCAYNYPEGVVFPANYTPPRMAVTDQYWKVWFQLFILASHMPAKFGVFCWQKFPLFQMLIEMAITNNFHFPPKNNEELLNRDLQLSQVEKVNILEFESYLASNQEINENNSYLLSTLISFENFPRRPANTFLEDLKTKCQRLRLSQLLYQSRNPDYLLKIIEQQQSNAGLQTLAPMPWLVELVETNEHNFGLLPVQCLCEFLFGQIAEELTLMSGKISCCGYNLRILVLIITLYSIFSFTRDNQSGA